MSHTEASQSCELGINIDHVATVRQARQTTEPDPVSAALEAEAGGADQIVLHLRKDRRHVQERDLDLLSRTVQTKLNLEMSTDPDVVETALQHEPDRVTIVPERRDEVTTEGGLDARQQEDRLSDLTKTMNKHDIDVNLFIDPVEAQIETSHRIDVQGIELHTGPYANADDDSVRASERETLSSASSYADDLGLFVAAGHGLNYQNTGPVASIPHVQELNIGHSIVARSIRSGMQQAVRDMVNLIHRAT